MRLLRVKGAGKLSFLMGVVVASVLFLGYTIYFSYQKANQMELIHVLKHPMIWGGTAKDDNYYLIPAGTTLYYERSMPEGFSTYRIYVNVEGVRLDPHESIQTGTIKPARIYPILKEDLLGLLKTVRLDAEDIKSILENGNFTREDKEEIKKILEKKGD